MVTSVLLALARSPAGRVLVGWFFTHMSFALPAKRLHETPTLVAFHHPRPSYPLHILLVPKRSLGDLTALSPADNDFLHDVFQTVKTLVQEMNLAPAGYRLIINGGAYQDVPYLHFHLIADQKPEEQKAQGV